MAAIDLKNVLRVLRTYLSERGLSISDLSAADIDNLFSIGITAEQVNDLIKAGVDEAKEYADNNAGSGSNADLTPYSTTAQMTSAIATAKQEAIDEANTQDDAHSTDDLIAAKGYTFSQADITQKDADTLASAKADATTKDTAILTSAKAYTDANTGDTNHFVRVVRKEGTSISDKDYYVENIAEIVQTDEYYIVNPSGGGDIPAANNGNYAIKGSDGTITYAAPRNGDTAFVYADRQRDITDGDGNLSSTDENRLVAVLIYEGGNWIITNSYFKNGNNNSETGTFANAEGDGNTASGFSSHAEGNRNTASGSSTHAEGQNNTVSGFDSHAEGRNNVVDAEASHAEGDGNIIKGGFTLAGHAEGSNNTLDGGREMHAEGQGNTIKTNYASVSGRNSVLAENTTLSGIGYSATVPSDAQKAGSADVNLVWKADRSGNTTQTGKVTATDFVKADGTAITTVPDASTTVKGKIKLANNTETQTGTDATRAVTPASLKSLTSTNTRKGLIETATTAETMTGTSTTLAATPAGVKSAIAAIPATDLSDYSTTVQVDDKDAATLTAAKAYTDENTYNDALDSLVYDMEWKAELQTYEIGGNTYSAPESPATIGLGYNHFTERVDFVFPDATNKAAVDALVINRKIVFEIPNGVATINVGNYESSVVVSGGYHRERYTATIDYPSADTVSNNNNNLQITLYRATDSDIDLSAYSNTTQVDAKDTATLNLAKADATTKANTAETNAKTHTFSQAQITQKDSDVLTAAKSYADAEDAKHTTADNSYTDAEINKVKALIEDVSTGIMGHSVDDDGNLVLTFNDGTTVTIDVSALLSEDINALKLRLTAIETKNNGQDSSISAIETKNTEQDTKLSALVDEDTNIRTAFASADSTNLQAAKDYTYPKADIDSKDSALKTRMDTFVNLPNAGLTKTEQLTFFHDPNRIKGTGSLPMYQIIDILKGSDASAKALYTERQTGSFVSETNFNALTTEDFDVNGEMHEAIVATIPGNFNDFSFLVVEFNDNATELAKTVYIPVATIANGFDWVISDAGAIEDSTKRELRVRLEYDIDSNTTKIKFHQERVTGETQATIYLFVSFFLKLAARGERGPLQDLSAYYTKTQSDTLRANLQAAIDTKEDSTHIFEHTPNYFTGGFIGGDSGYTFGGDLWGDAVGSLVAPNKGKITIMNTSYDIEIIAAYNNGLVFGIHPDDEAETLAWFANKKIIFTGFVEGTKVEYSLLGSSALLQFSGSDFESFRFPYTANFLQENAQSLLIGNPFTVTIADVNAEAKTYVSKFDTIISNDPPINSVGSDGMTWIKEDGSNGHIRIDGVWKPKTNTEYSTTTAIDAKISGLKIKEKAVRVFANRALKEPANTAEGWDFKSVNTGILKVESGQETPTAAASLTAYKGMSIAVPKTIWNAMDKILITASHANQVALTTFIPVYKDDLVASIPKDVGFSGSGRLKAELFYDENKDQNENVNNELNRLVIQMKEGLVPEKSGFYIGEVVFTHLELVNTS